MKLGLAAPAILAFPRGLQAAPGTTTWDAANKNFLDLLSGSDLTATVTMACYTFAMDFTNNLFWVHNSSNGLWNNSVSADPATGTGGWSPSPALTAGTFYPAVYLQTSPNNSITANFGALTIANLPSGFSTLNSATGASVTWDTSFNASGNMTYSNGNLTVTQANSAGYPSALLSRATNGVSSGKVCWEIYAVTFTNWEAGFVRSDVANTNYMHEVNNKGATGTTPVWAYNNAGTGTGAAGTRGMNGSSTRGTLLRTSGRLMFEATMTWGGLRDVALGVCGTSFAPSSGSPGAADTWCYDRNTSASQTVYNGGSASTGKDALTNGQALGIYVDFSTAELWYYMASGVNRYNSSATADPATNTGGIDISAIIGSGLYPLCGGGSSAALQLGPGIVTANFGATAFTSPTPSGFRSWNDGPLASGRSRGIIVP